MTNYNRSEIMTKANKIRKAYNVSKSEALSKAWGLARLQDLEAQKFLLEMKDRWNAKDRQKNDELSNAIYALYNKLFPKIPVTQTRDNLTSEQRKRMTALLAELKSIENPTWQDKARISNIEFKLETSIKTWTSYSFDESIRNIA